MNRKIMIKEKLDIESSAIKIHIINMKEDSHIGGVYRQISASEGMIERSSKRWYYHWSKKKYNTHCSQIRFDRWREDDERYYNETKKRMLGILDKEAFENLYPEIIEKHHNSVWDFFDYIGYDYKNKKVANTDKLIFIKEKIK
mgnify:CR=1 FL=1